MPNKRDRRAFKLPLEVKRGLRLANFFFEKDVYSPRSLRNLLKDHVEKHDYRIQNLHGRNLQPCCYDLLKAAFSSFGDEVEEYLFSIEINGVVYPPPRFVVPKYGPGVRLLLPDYGPEYNLHEICYRSISKYEDLLNCLRVLATIIKFNQELQKEIEFPNDNGDSCCVGPETTWDLMDHSADPEIVLRLKPTAKGALRADIEGLVSAILACDTTRIQSCAICRHFFWRHRSSGRFCGDACRQRNRRLQVYSERVDRELRKYKKQRATFPVDHPMVVEQAKILKDLHTKGRRFFEE